MSDENHSVREQLEPQLKRLSKQLKDLEKKRRDMNDHEYNEAAADTRKQLLEFSSMLGEVIADHIRTYTYAIYRANFEASKNAFQAPGLIPPSDAENEPNVFRNKYYEIERDIQSGKLSLEVGNRQKLAVLIEMKCLGSKLTNDDIKFILEEISKI